jgi:nitronate monooxygenase
MLGASAVQIGTAFLRCAEANVPDAYRSAVRDASDTSTVVTDLITGRPARLIRNKLTYVLIASGLEPLSFPAQMSFTAPLGTNGDREMVALFAGQSAALAKDTTAGSSLSRFVKRRLGGYAPFTIKSASDP